MTVEPSGETDPRLVAGAYISRGINLYEVVSYNPTGMRAEQLYVENCLTLKRLTFFASEIEDVELVRAAPTLDIPDTLAAA